jgi:hypothetical protein
VPDARIGHAYPATRRQSPGQSGECAAGPGPARACPTDPPRWRTVAAACMGDSTVPQTQAGLACSRRTRCKHECYSAQAETRRKGMETLMTQCHAFSPRIEQNPLVQREEPKEDRAKTIRTRCRKAARGCKWGSSSELDGSPMANKLGRRLNSCRLGRRRSSRSAITHSQEFHRHQLGPQSPGHGLDATG